MLAGGLLFGGIFFGLHPIDHALRQHRGRAGTASG